jgi:ferritin-like metal-binding protein YciE
MMKLESLHDLYVKELRDLYDAERQLVKALPKMAKAASSPELQNDFQEHLEFKGVVQLSGFVDSEKQISRAVEIAKGVKGVMRLENKLVVKGTQ